MNDLIQLVDEFHHAFSIPRRENPAAALDASEYELRYDLMVEENDEYLEACQEQNLEKIADALGDQLYVLLGTIITHGLQNKMAAVFEEIHRSNMSKLGPDGKPIYRADGKILKSETFFRPDMKTALGME
jgi:predicted HAD superfamily Cof-like phosphohydrolase